jgi:hypothetical protein
MKTVKLKIRSHDGKEEEELTLNFDAQEVETLRRYIENCKRLRGAPLLQNFPAVKKINFNLDEGSRKFEISEFQYEQVYDLLHRARPIFLHREPASFNKVKAIFGKKSKNTNLAKILKKVVLDYDKGEYQQYFQLYVGKLPESARAKPEEWLNQDLNLITSKTASETQTYVYPLFHENTLDAWLNGIEYHQDKDKAEIVKRIEESLTQETARGIFVSQMSGRLKAILWLEELSQFILNNRTNTSE